MDSDILACINELRNEEGATLMLSCDNPECGTSSAKITVRSDWTRWGGWDYVGDNILECLEKAVAAKKTLTETQPVPTEPGGNE